MKNFWNIIEFISGLSVGIGFVLVLKKILADYSQFWCFLANILAFILCWTVLIGWIHLLKNTYI